MTWPLTYFASKTAPTVRARAMELCTTLDASPTVCARPGDAWVLDDFAVETGKPFRTTAEVLIWVSVLACSSVLARLVGAAVVEIWNVIKVSLI